MVSLLLRFYQKFLSPLLHGALASVTGTVHACRFEPTCSEYFRQSSLKYGIIRGGFKGLVRLVRCNPLSRGGYDPVR